MEQQASLPLRKSPPNPAHALITDRQREIFDYIKAYMTEYGVAPTQDIVAKHFKVRRHSIAYTIDALVRKGALVKIPGRARGIALPKVETDNNPI